MKEILKLAIENKDIAELLGYGLIDGYCPNQFGMNSAYKCKNCEEKRICKECWEKSLNENN